MDPSAVEKAAASPTIETSNGPAIWGNALGLLNKPAGEILRIFRRAWGDPGNRATQRELGELLAELRRFLFAISIPTSGRIPGWDVEEIVNEAEHKIVVAIFENAYIDKGLPFTSWAGKVITNVIKDAKNSAGVRNRVDSEDLLDSLPAPGTELCLLRVGLERLSDRDREAIGLHFFDGLTYSEMGEILGISEDGARKRTTRALEGLQTIMNFYKAAGGESSEAAQGG